MYRRAARERAYVESLENRVAVLESYVEALHHTAIATSTDEGNRENTVARKTANKAQTATTAPISKVSKEVYNDTIVTEKPETEPEENGKFRTVVKVELNTADSAMLIRIPGIGSGTAHAIISYREKLGGYYCSDQLRERITWEGSEKYMDEWCNEWFWTDVQFVQKLAINELSFKELVHHPYLSYDQVKAICQWRDRHKGIAGRGDLEQMGVFGSDELDRLMHYVTFDSRQ